MIMYNNILLLLKNLRAKQYVQYTDYNITGDHLKEFYNKHNELFEVNYIKLYLFLNGQHDGDLELLEYVANYTRQGKYDFLGLIRSYIRKEHYNFLVELVKMINPEYQYMLELYWNDDFCNLVRVYLVPLLITNIDKENKIKDLENICKQFYNKLMEQQELLNMVRYSPGGVEYQRMVEELGEMNIGISKN